MKKRIPLLMACLLHFSVMAQIPKIPPKPDHVSAEDYREGKHMLAGALSQSEGEELCYADYWNFAVSLGLMGQDSAVVWQYVVKAQQSDPNSFCTLAKYEIEVKGGLDQTCFYKRFNKQYERLLAGCADGPALCEGIEALKDASHFKGYHYDLIQQLHSMMDKDQRYRRNNLYQTNREKQALLDHENQQELIRIFEEWGYPGNSLVGPEYSHCASLILEHGGDLSLQEKYLPLVVSAYHQQEVNKVILWMLIDRIHWKKTGHQIFGSQHGKPFDTEEVIESIKKQYGLN